MKGKGKLALVGAGASGKDFLRKKMMDKGLKYGVSVTSRPPRPNEVEGEDYYFVTDSKFKNMIINNEFIEWQSFNDWKYGITRKEFEECDIMILNAEAVNLLEEDIRNRIFVIYIDIEESIREERLKQRHDADNYKRRLEADKIQFRNFENYDIKITNPNF